MLTGSDVMQVHPDRLARIVLDGMFQFVGLLSVDGLTLEINRAALEGAALRIEDVRGRPFWEARWWAVSDETVRSTRELVLRAGRGEFVRCDVEVFGRAAGEETIVIDFSLLPVRDERGQIVFLLAEGRDITEKKRAEAEIARKNAELQTLLDKLRQADQLKSDLFANISHELRTPLALILGPAEAMLAAGDTLGESQRRDLGIIQRSAATLLGHVNDLLDLAKVDAGKMAARYVRLDLAGALRRTAEQFHALAPQRQVLYAVAMPEAMEAEVDPDQVERVLLNLLSNAFKFTPPGGRIRCALEVRERASFVLSVQDSGPGVPAGMRRAVFERFRQVAGGTRREVGGTGLGLAIAKEFVDLHRGTIVVSQAPGGGALFQVEMPLRAPAGAYVREAQDVLPREASPVAWAAPDLGTVPAPEDAGQAEAPSTGERPTVLVVEDNPDMRRFVTGVLAADHRVVAAADGAQALLRAQAEPPDLVVTDLMMPRLGGDELVAAMRADPRLAAVPVLVLSAKGDELLRARLLAQSVQDYVTKPFSAHELRARARNLVMMKRARDALRRELASQSEDLSELTRELIANQRALERSMEALLESEQRWRALFEHSPVGIVLVDAAGRIRASNPAFQRMLGYARQEMRDRSMVELAPEEDQPSMRARIARLIAGHTDDGPSQTRLRRRDGGIVWAGTSASVVPETAGAPPMLALVAEDITEVKRSAEALARTRHELARVARVSTLGELAASIAHEVNQPLGAIVANGHACLRWLDAHPPDADEAEAAVQRIVRDANRASEVISRIRGFLRRGDLLPQPVDVAAVIDEVVGLLKADARAQGVSIVQAPGGPLPTVQVDRVQLQQVVLNLVMNALEAMPPSQTEPRRLDLGVVPAAGGEALQVDVCDTGVGIDASQHDRIFDAFHTSKPEGMGMGLAISRSIVESHGGRLWVTSRPQRGVCFHFTLPLAGA